MEGFASLFGVVDAVLRPYVALLILVLVLVNMVARALEYRSIVSDARDGGIDSVSRSGLRVATNFLLVVLSFYYATVHFHAGTVLSILVVGMVITDLFEFESRLVEIRQEFSIDRPNAAIAASVLVLMYISYLTLFQFVKPFWSQVV
ncbi:hypothetical protein ACFPYI_02980 [Halomarina salina]|uniref:DUF7313 domain-containing protein n=1 Tax=Halomarina salina TaxID=1872699 RepID=A0ABD5RI91_9EURY|nr:hypothetical protein [Halomarina salina]